ncbi:MAG: helix-turn-helix transcriptional regulator [Acidaminococcaceae bacterium]|nr:helix-turn-helix transcriptional regulator [Acidaminococcaceae bacterium]
MIEGFIFYSPELIRQVRKKAKMTQAKFGKYVDRVSAGTVSRWEHGRMVPTPRHFAKIAELDAMYAKIESADGGAAVDERQETATGKTHAAAGEEGICHCPTCRQINKMIQALEHRKQLLVDYRNSVHSGLPGPVPWRE